MRRLIYAILIVYATAILLPLLIKAASPHIHIAPSHAEAESTPSGDYLELTSNPAPDSTSVLVAITAHIHQPVQTCSLILIYDPTQVTILDADPAAEGTQIEIPTAEIDPSMIQRNIAASGVITLALQGEPLLSGEHPVILGLIHLQRLTDEPTGIAISSAYITDPQGSAIWVKFLQPPDQPLLLTPIAPPPAQVPPPATPTPLPPTAPPPPPTATPLPAPPPAATPSTPTPLPATMSGSDCGYPSTRDGIYTRILQGQTLYGLAQAFGISTEALMLANGITDPTTIPAETLLFIPIPPPAGMGTSAYYVAPYDTLRTIADAFNLPVEAILCRNGDILADGLQAGEWLRLRP